MGRLEAKNLIPVEPRYDPRSNFRKLRVTLGWVPWEEPIAIIDKTVAAPPIPSAVDKPQEPAIGPGLQPPPAKTAPAKK
jgi:outer membrane protein